MADWANAIASGIGAAAKSGADSIDQQQRQEAAAIAEQRAADVKLATAERIMAIEEAQKNRAAERFAAIVKNKMGGTPLEVAPGDPAPQTNEGMLNKPSLDQATQAALEESLQNDPAAFMAGQGMLAQGVKGDLEERKLESREKIAAAELARKEKADEARAANDAKRIEALFKRIDKSSSGGGGGGSGKGSKPAMIQTVEYMRDVLKYPPEKIEKFIFDRKSISEEELAVQITNAARKNHDDITPAEAVAQARELKSAAAPKTAAAAATAKPAVKALPAGAKQIGTSGGKPVYQTPDGKKFIQG